MSGLHDKIKIDIKEIAFSKGNISPLALDDILENQSLQKAVVDLIKEGMITEKEYLSIAAKNQDLTFLDLGNVEIDPAIANEIPGEIATKYTICPILDQAGILTVAVCDPLNILMFDDLKVHLKKDLIFVVSEKEKIVLNIDKLYKQEDNFLEKIGEEVDSAVSVDDAHGIDSGAEDSGADDAPIVKVVDLIVTESLSQRASDIHIEPQKDSVRVRYRVDGVMHEVHSLPKKNQNAIISRMKIMSGLNITETRVPQDGRFKIRLKKKEVDFRVSSLPTRYGEKFVLRALDKSNLSVGLENSGFSATPLMLFEKALQHPWGIVLVTGPTGSGKSTTLYSVLNSLNTVDRHIITIEDPVEYQVDGLTQIPINHEIKMTFASALRAVLRQSPDVVMVGEIRDAETADIAIKASLTGQFILSTLHTNDSIGAITRLIDMGVEPFLLASSIVMTSAQRLCRRICTNCKEEYIATDSIYERLQLTEKVPLYRGKGCDACDGSGYKGREAVLEVLFVDSEIKNMIVARATEKEIATYARANVSFKTLREDVVDKCLRGVTTVEEVFRVTM